MAIPLPYALDRTLARVRRRIVSFLKPAPALVVFDPEYALPPNGFADSFRGARIAHYLATEGCLHRGHVLSPPRLGVGDLARIHGWPYLIGLEDPETARIIFGQELPESAVTRFVEVQRRMAAGTVFAAHLALGQRRPIPVVNLGGGFHHAASDRGAGFCAFNDVAVAIAALRHKGFGDRILVVDLDLHQGDGTRSVFAADSSVFTFSIHAIAWDESPAIATLDVALGTGVSDHTYLEAVRANLAAAIEECKPGFAFYVAGVDVAADDKIGSWRISEDAILERDRMVLAALAGLPLVVVLAGGYGRDAWRYTARTLAWLFASYDERIQSHMNQRLDDFRAIASQWRPPLAERPDFDLSTAELFGDPSHRNGGRLLGLYSPYGIECALERYGVLDVVKTRIGTDRLQVVVDVEAGDHRVRLLTDDGRRDVLIELILRQDYRSRPPFAFLSIDWLLLQNPRALPSKDRPLLPGQSCPSLGCLGKVVMMLVLVAERLGLDGLCIVPTHYHVAAMSRGRLEFIEPEDEARFLAMEAAVEGLDLDRSSRLVERGDLRDLRTGESVHWTPALMVLPVSRRLGEHLQSETYGKSVETASARLEFAVVGDD